MSIFKKIINFFKKWSEFMYSASDQIQENKRRSDPETIKQILVNQAVADNIGRNIADTYATKTEVQEEIKTASKRNFIKIFNHD